MSVTFKDIGDLSQKSSVAGTEKIHVSDTEYITPSQIAGLVTADSSLSRTSTNPIQNGYATRTFVRGFPCTPVSDNTPGYKKIDGTVNTSATNYGYIIYDVSAGSHYAFSTHFGTTIQTGVIRAVLWLDSNGDVLSYSDQANNISATKNYYDEILIAPTGATQAAVNYHKDYAWAGTLKKVAPPSPDCELNTNKVTSLSSASTDTQYPSAKCVYDAIPDTSGFQATSNIVTSLSSNSTDVQYPSAKCVYDLLGDVETLINAL